jgi:hypothetical protein
MIDGPMTYRNAQPPGQRAAPVVAGKPAPILKHPRDEFLSQVFALGKVPAGLFRATPRDREIGVRKVLPGDVVSPGTGDRQEEILDVHAFERHTGPRPAFGTPGRGRRCTGQDLFDPALELLKLEGDRGVPSLATFECLEDFVVHLRPHYPL